MTSGPISSAEAFDKIILVSEAMVMPIPVPHDHDYLRTCAQYDSDLDLPLSISEISQAVQTIKKKKAAGLVFISPVVMKFAFPKIFTVIHSIFDKAFSQAECPMSWKIAKLIPFYKGKRNKTDPLCHAA